MGKFTKEMVDEYAEKLLINLTPEENKMVLDEFEISDKNCDIVNNIDNIKNVVPMSYCLDDFSFELREDIVEESDNIEDLLSNCEQVNEREIELPKVVG